VFQISLKVSLGYVVLAIGVSSAVGIVSGWYPAARAARLDPVEALRAE
jgi:putative ABC transport system permease protein